VRWIYPVVAALTACLFAVAAFADNSAHPTGTFTPGHPITSTLPSGSPYADGGGAAGSNTLNKGYLKELGLTNTGTPFCINDGLTSGAYHQFCLGAFSLGGGLITYNAKNGATPLPLQLIINGVAVPIPGSVTGLPNVAGTAAMTALAHTFAALIVREDYELGYGAPPQFFASSASPCSLNSGAGDGGSQVPTNDGGCWLAQFGPEVDWREWGNITTATDNRATFQAALDATFNAARKLSLCGAGSFKTSTVYFYTSPVEWCAHTTIVKRINAGPVMVFAGSVVGGTYPDFPETASLQGFDLRYATIDMNSSLLTTGGAGIVASASYDWSMYDPWVWNVPTMTTPSGVVSGSPRGTWAYTASNRCPSSNAPCDAAVTGWVENAGIALLGSPVKNLENGKIWKGMVGNFAYPTSACDATLGSTGILFGVPSQMMQTQSPNPGNGNTIENTLADCNQIGIRNDYASGVTILQADTTSNSGLVGITNGTYGRYDVTVSGTASGTSNVAVTMMADGLTGSPVTAFYTGTGGADTAAAAIVSFINNPSNNLTAYDITAAVWPGCTATSCTFHIDYGDEFSTDGTVDPPLNFNFCSNGSPGNNSHCSGALRLTPYHTATWNWIQQTPSELNIFAYVYDGANSASNAVVQPQQLTGTPYRIHNHAGQGGSVNPINIANFGKNAGNSGATLPASISDCSGDQSPYWVSTGSGAVSTVLWGLSEGYTECHFKDSTAGGGWGTSAFTIQAPTAVWGQYTINGQAAQSYITNYGQVDLTLYPANNNTVTGAPGNNAGGDWIGGGDTNAVLGRRTAGTTSWTSSTTPTQIGSGAGKTLDVPLAAGTSYNCTMHLSVTASGAGGIAVRFASSGGLSATSMSFTGTNKNGGTINAATKATALNSDIVAFNGVATDVDVVGSITVNEGGTLSGQAAQGASNGTTTSVGPNSALNCNKVN
jgi:hypothetical protein